MLSEIRSGAPPQTHHAVVTASYRNRLSQHHRLKPSSGWSNARSVCNKAIVEETTMQTYARNMSDVVQKELLGCPFWHNGQNSVYLRKFAVQQQRPHCRLQGRQVASSSHHTAAYTQQSQALHLTVDALAAFPGLFALSSVQTTGHSATSIVITVALGPLILL